MSDGIILYLEWLTFKEECKYFVIDETKEDQLHYICKMSNDKKQCNILSCQLFKNKGKGNHERSIW